MESTRVGSVDFRFSEGILGVDDEEVGGDGDVVGAPPASTV